MTTDNKFRTDIIERFWANTQVSREDIFGSTDPFPLVERANADHMWSGYVGRNYRPGGLVLVANFPAGGTDAYEGTARANRDKSFYEHILSFKRSTPGRRAAAFDDLMNYCRVAIQGWRMAKVIDIVLNAAKVNIDDVAIINFVPYRIGKNKKASRHAIDSAWRFCTGPALSILKPGRIAALGLAAGNELAKCKLGDAVLFKFQRTIGDGYVHEEAKREASRLSANISQDR